jgi:hypothetical protein
MEVCTLHLAAGAPSTKPARTEGAPAENED